MGKTGQEWKKFKPCPKAAPEPNTWCTPTIPVFKTEFSRPTCSTLYEFVSNKYINKKLSKIVFWASDMAIPIIPATQDPQTG